MMIIATRVDDVIIEESRKGNGTKSQHKILLEYTFFIWKYDKSTHLEMKA